MKYELKIKLSFSWYVITITDKECENLAYKPYGLLSHLYTRYHIVARLALGGVYIEHIVFVYSVHARSA